MSIVSNSRALPVIFGTLLLDMVGTGMVFPIIPILFTDPASHSFLLQGYSPSAQYFIAGLIIAFFGLMQFIAAPILGELSDAYGRKKLLLLGVGLLAVSQAVFGFGISIASVTILFIARAVAGLAGANFSIAQAVIADITEPKDRAKNFGLIGAAFGIGFIIGPLLGGWIAGVAGDAAAPFWFASVLGVINVLFVSYMLPETRRISVNAQKSFTILKGIHNIRDAFRDVDARPVYISSFLYVCGFSFLPAFMGVMLVVHFGLNEAGIGTFFGIVGVWVVITQMFLLRLLTARYSEKQILRVSLLALSGGIGIYPFLPSTALVFALVPIIAVPQGLCMANMQALVSHSVSADKQGAALGINGSLLALASGIVPIFVGAMSGILGVQLPFLVGAFSVVASWFVLFVWMRR